MSITVNEIKQVIAKLSNLIIENEAYFCDLDSVAGDGDFGMSLAKGFRVVKEELDEMDGSSVSALLRDCSLVIVEHCGGASGPLWGGAFRAASKSVKSKDTLEISDVAGMFESACEGIMKRGGAKQGDKTLLDALIPAAQALRKAANEEKTVKEAFKDATAAAQAGAEATKEMVASRGRASYVGERSLGYPDAGAMAVAVLFAGLTA
jgi:dihydroxyacetone kinase-like protein